MVLSTTEAALQGVVSEVTSDVAKTSAFQSLGRKVPVTRVGETVKIVRVKRGLPQYTAEGARKPVVDPTITELDWAAKKLADVMLYTSEFGIDFPAIVRDLQDQAPSTYAEQFDSYTMGNAPTSANWGDFDGVLAAPEITDLATWNAALAQIGNAGHSPSGMVITSAFKWQLLSLTYADGRAIFTDFDGRINGIEYREVASATPEAIIGDFARQYQWGVYQDRLNVKLATTGTVTDSANVVHNLFQDNKAAVLTEGYFASLVRDETAFARLTIGAAPFPGE